MTERGSRLFWPPGGSRKAEVATGQAGGLRIPARPTWMDQRADLPCKQHPANWWFAPEEDETGRKVSGPTERDQAIELCEGCPMQLACREHGLRHHQYGIWGALRVDGLKAQQRRDLLERTQRQLQRRSA